MPAAITRSKTRNSWNASRTAVPDQNYAIIDKIEVTLFSASDVFKQAVAENEAYIAGETQAVAIKWAAAADGLEANDADGEAFAFTTVKA